MANKLWLVAGLALTFAACKNERAPNDERAGTNAGQDSWAPGNSTAGTGATTGTPEPSPTSENGSGARAGTAGPARKATAKFESAPGVTLAGDATLEEQGRGVRIVLTLSKAPPGDKAVHIHEKGDCSNIPGKSMGEHFAPRGEKHGLPSDTQHHPGDLGNIKVASDGTGRLEIVTDAGNLVANDPLSFAGRAIVVHASHDKGTPPSGDSGTPIACAVIK